MLSVDCEIMSQIEPPILTMLDEESNPSPVMFILVPPQLTPELGETNVKTVVKLDV
jgi:hypothetical protein